MFDLYIQKACADQAKEAHVQKLAEAMKVLPLSELEKIACGGLSGLCHQDEWVKAFEGTPLFDKALQIAHQLLELDMQRMQANQQRSAQMDIDDASRRQLSNQMDMLRVQQRSLGLELAQFQQAQMTMPQLPQAAPEAPEAVESAEPVHPPMLAKAAAAMRASMQKWAGIGAIGAGAAGGAALGFGTTGKDDNAVSIAGKTVGGAALGTGLATAGHIAHGAYNAYDPNKGIGHAVSEGWNQTKDSVIGKKPIVTPVHAPQALPQNAGQNGIPVPVTEVVSGNVRPPSTTAPVSPLKAQVQAARAAKATAKAQAAAQAAAQHAAESNMLGHSAQVAANGVAHAAENSLKSRFANGVMKVLGHH